ncbi:MAG: PIN domain-containing protein [Acidimicrobiales bacterium]
MILLDASALLALLRQEAGADVVAEALEDQAGAVSVVNLAEVLEHATRTGSDASERLAELRGVFMFEPVTEADALGAAELYPLTRRPALSLADRIALATARRLGVTVLTAERAWADVPGVAVRVIR